MSVWQKAGLNISRVTDFKQAWTFFLKQKKKLVGLRFEVRLFEIESRITLSPKERTKVAKKGEKKEEEKGVYVNRIVKIVPCT